MSAALLRGQAAGHVDPELDRDTVVFLLIALFDGIAGRAAFSQHVNKRRLASGVDHLLRNMLTAPAVAKDERSQ